ncbi:MAG: class I SAM-dependent methyltransferase [Thermoplasmatota archaeon]
MVQAAGVRSPRKQAEATRRRLSDLGVLRTDLDVAHVGEDILFPVADSCGPRLPTERFDFDVRHRRPAHYSELLPWPAPLLALVPRAFEHLGDIVVVKVPEQLRERAAELGGALLAFHGARAVFHDHGVAGDFRTRRLERIAGAGGSLVCVGENGARLWVDLERAYFSPRLATERARVVAQVRPGEHLVDLFGGVAPLGVEAAKAGARVDTVDLNPAAAELARRNAHENGVQDRVTVWEGDARAIACRLAPAERIVMNLPHGAHLFLAEAARLAKPGTVLHYHEILAPESVEDRARSLEADLAALGKAGRVRRVRQVRNYAAQLEHAVFDWVADA